MPYTKQDLKNLHLDDTKPIDFYPIVQLKIFDNINDIILSSRIKDEYRYTLDIYKEYLETITKLNKSTQDKLLRDFKSTEIIENHTLESESYDRISAFNVHHNSIAFNYLLRKLFIEQKPLSPNIMAKGYEILMRGTSNEKEIKANHRINNNHIVGYIENNERRIDFLPISYDEIDWALAYFISYFNQPELKEEELLIKPFVLHGLIAALQMYEDGNTRLGRTFQHLKMFMLTNKFLDPDLKLPILYFSRTYLPYRKQYRDFIANIAINPTNENWNQWILFNLRRVQDQINYNEDSLSRMLIK